MNLIWGILEAAGIVFVQMAPFLVLGFFLAGWLYVLISKETVADKLGHQRRLGPLWAALVGIPLPLCSCGVLPFARLLKDRKASPGSIVSFLLTTPQTGADSIAVSASILGWPLTLWKVGTAFVSGILGGFAANAITAGTEDEPASTKSSQNEADAKLACSDHAEKPEATKACCEEKRPQPPPSDCCSGHMAKPMTKATCCEDGEEASNPRRTASCCETKHAAPPQEDCCENKASNPPPKMSCCDARENTVKPVASSYCDSSGKPPEAATEPASCCSTPKPKAESACPPPGKLRTALYYGFFQNLGDVAGWLVWGILGAGIIAYAVPPDFFGQTIQSSWVEMLVILAIAIPLYVCATGSIPIGAALAAKGLSAGAVMVFLIAGPAMSAVSLAVLGRTLGRRLLLVYLTTIVVLSVASGMAFNTIFPNLSQTLPPVHECEHIAWWQIVFAALLGGLLLLHFFQRTARKLGKAWLRICPECLSFCLKGCECCGCAH